MTDAREIIRIAAEDKMRFDGFSSYDEMAEHLIDALASAGYRILGPDEVDPVTLEKALVAVNEIVQRGYSAAYRGGASDCDAAIRALATSKGGER